MADDTFDPDQFIKKYEAKPQGTQERPPDAIVTSSGTPYKPSSTMEYEGPQFGTGVARGAASLVQDVPGVPSGVRQFANAPSTGGPENVGRFVGQTIPFAVNPFDIGAAGAARAAPTIGRFAERVAPYAWDYLAGAANNPDNRTAGGLAGLATGGATRGLGNILARQRLIPRDMSAANLEMYEWALQPIKGQAPSRAAGTSLADIRDQIAQPLNAANQQLSLDMTSPQGIAAVGTINALRDNTVTSLSQASKSGADWSGDVDNFVLNPIRNRQGRFTGQQFADYINKIRNRADDLAQSARSSGDLDLYKRADGLRLMADQIEAASDGPAAAKQARADARTAYYRWSVLNDSSDPTNNGIVKPSAFQSEYVRRHGTNSLYSNQRTDPWLQRVEQMRAGLEGGPGFWEQAAKGAGHTALWHLGGPLHLAYFLGRPGLGALARRAQQIGRGSQTVVPRSGPIAAAGSQILGPMISPFLPSGD